MDETIIRKKLIFKYSDESIRVKFRLVTNGQNIDQRLFDFRLTHFNKREETEKYNLVHQGSFHDISG